MDLRQDEAWSCSNPGHPSMENRKQGKREECGRDDHTNCADQGVYKKSCRGRQEHQA